MEGDKNHNSSVTIPAQMENSNNYKWFHGTDELYFEKVHAKESYYDFSWDEFIEFKASVELSLFDDFIPFTFAITKEDEAAGSSGEDGETFGLVVRMNIFASLPDDRDWDDITSDDIEWDQWNVPDVQFEFSLVKLKFYSDDNKLAFTKYLHLERIDEADCGCPVDHPFSNGTCSDYIGGDECHKMTVTTKFNRFCTVEEIQKLKKPFTTDPELKKQPNGVNQIRVVADFMFGTRTHHKGSPNSVAVPGSRRQKILNERKPDIVFKLQSGATATAHKDVLFEGQSDMLKCMMESEMLESQSGVIQVTDESFTLPIFEDFLNGLYGDWTNDEMEKNCDNLQLLFSRLRICNYYSALQLLDLNIGVLVGNPHTVFSNSSALEMYEIGMEYNIPCLKTRYLQWKDWKEIQKN